jgi:putative zinc finger protein
MRCTEARPLFSSYLDGAVSGAEMHRIALHLHGCDACQSEYVLLENTRAVLTSLGRRQPPPELAMKIRIAIASGRSRRRRDILRGLAVRIENVCNAFMFPATAGMITAIFLFALLIGFFVTPQVSAYDDVPTMLYVPPRLEMAGYTDDLNLQSPVVVEAYVDSSGRVENYRIIAGRDDDDVRMQLNQALLFTVFAPAHSFGRAVPGRAVISFSHIKVRG